jgi:diguanylate cyclase (GGDEF)-like protein
MLGAKLKLITKDQERQEHVLMISGHELVRGGTCRLVREYSYKTVHGESLHRLEQARSGLHAPKVWRRAIQGTALGFGAPLGWLGIRFISGTSPRADIVAFPGLYLYMLVATMLVFGAFGAFLGLREKRLQDDSVTDALTGLRNLRYFLARTEEAYAETQRLGQPLAVAVIDLDHFKSVNDTYGHPIGDLLLSAMAQSLASVVRRADTAARVGGEEFALLLPGMTGEQAKSMGERVQQAICQTSVRLNDRPDKIRVTTSIGVASTAEWPGAGPDELYAAADAALYHAKHQGRDQVILALPLLS